MPRLSIGRILEATGGTLLRGDPDAVVDSFEIDTRRVREGGLFFALKGEKTDGHRFLDQAAGRGALAAVVTREIPEGEPAPAVLIRVEDATRADRARGRASVPGCLASLGLRIYFQPLSNRGVCILLVRRR